MRNFARIRVIARAGHVASTIRTPPASGGATADVTFATFFPLLLRAARALTRLG